MDHLPPLYRGTAMSRRSGSKHDHHSLRLRRLDASNFERGGELRGYIASQCGVQLFEEQTLVAIRAKGVAVADQLRDGFGGLRGLQTTSIGIDGQHADVFELGSVKRRLIGLAQQDQRVDSTSGAHYTAVGGAGEVIGNDQHLCHQWQAPTGQSRAECSTVSSSPW